jgi:threonine efflux protein
MLLSLVSLLMLQIVAVAMPGPDFLLVVQTTLRYGRYYGYIAATGTTSGVILYCSTAVFGYHFLTTSFKPVTDIIALGGAIFLIYLSWQCFRQSGISLNDAQTSLTIPSKKHIWTKALITNLSNPKVVIYFLSILPLFMTDSSSIVYHLAIILMVALATIGWFGAAATLMGYTRIRQAYLNYAFIVEKIFGSLLLLFAILLIVEILH